jgi:hypothetical protein
MNENEVFTKELEKAFLAVGIELPKLKLEEITENNLKVADDFLLVQKYGRPAVRIIPKELASFEEIVEIGEFNNGYYEHLKKNGTCRKAIFAPVSSTSEEELVLYYEGENQIIPGGKDIYAYFNSKGFEVVEKAHPSLLINAMHKLTEERLTEMDIPSHVDIVLPTFEDFLLPDERGGLCFLRAYRSDGCRELDLDNFRGEWGGHYAFLLRKKKV